MDIVARNVLSRYGSDDLVIRLIELFLDDVPKMVALLNSALAAGALTTVARSAHTLRGCSANLGACVLEAHACEIERAAKKGDVRLAMTLASRLEEIARRTEDELREELERRTLHHANA